MISLSLKVRERKLLTHEAKQQIAAVSDFLITPTLP